jgi:hypothetical protein
MAALDMSVPNMRPSDTTTDELEEILGDEECFSPSAGALDNYPRGTVYLSDSELEQGGRVSEEANAVADMKEDASATDIEGAAHVLGLQATRTHLELYISTGACAHAQCA